MANNREISQFGNYLIIDENVNKNVGIATTVRISGGGGLYVGGIEVISPTGIWKGPGSGLIGAQGAQGSSGSQGSVGAQGAQGSAGSQGSSGAQGSAGAQGAQGSSGAQGAQGTAGAQGSAGSQGSSGAQGSAGAQGAQGSSGAQGAQGSSGAQGAQGTAGAQGAQGTAGSSSTNGLGHGQTWTDVSGSRSSGVTYTNSTGKPIVVLVDVIGRYPLDWDPNNSEYVQLTPTQYPNLIAYVNGSRVPAGYNAVSFWTNYIAGPAPTYSPGFNGGNAPLVNMIVPNGSTYRIDWNTGATLIYFYELR